METIVDLSYLETVCEGDKEFMQEMIQAFVSTVPENMTEIKSSAASKKWSEVAKVAHKMKPSVTFMGIVPMKEKILTLEATAKQGEDVPLMNQLIADIDRIVVKAIEELNRTLEGMS